MALNCGMCLLFVLLSQDLQLIEALLVSALEVAEAAAGSEDNDDDEEAAGACSQTCALVEGCPLPSTSSTIMAMTGSRSSINEVSELEDLTKLAVGKLCMLLCQEVLKGLFCYDDLILYDPFPLHQGRDKEAAGFLESLGYLYRLSPCVLRYAMPPLPESPSGDPVSVVTSGMVSSVSKVQKISPVGSDGSLAQNKQKRAAVGGRLGGGTSTRKRKVPPIIEKTDALRDGRISSGNAEGAPEASSSSSKYVCAIDGAISSDMLEMMQVRSYAPMYVPRRGHVHPHVPCCCPMGCGLHPCDQTSLCIRRYQDQSITLNALMQPSHPNSCFVQPCTFRTISTPMPSPPMPSNSMRSAPLLPSPPMPSNSMRSAPLLPSGANTATPRTLRTSRTCTRWAGRLIRRWIRYPILVWIYRSMRSRIWVYQLRSIWIRVLLTRSRSRSRTRFQ